MPDIPTGVGPNAGHDRLNALRQNSQSQIPRFSYRKIRIELLIGAAAFVVLIAVLFVLLGTRAPQVATVTTLVGVETPASGKLQNGEALIPLALEEGSFPPHVEAGDLVRIVVSPNSDGTGSTRGLVEETIVDSMSGPSDIGGRYVMTIRGPETVAVAIAASGPLHVAIIREARK